MKFTVIILFIVTIVASSVVTVFYKNHTKNAAGSLDAVWLFIGLSLPVSLIYLVLCIIGGFSFAPSTVFTAVAAAVCHSAAVLALLKSMKKGSFAISVIIINLNFCVPIILSLIFLNEKASFLQIAGILLLTGLIVFINREKKHTDTSETSPNNSEPDKGSTSSNKSPRKISYLIYAVIACLTNGLMNFFIKTQQYFTPGQGENTFYLVLYLTEAIGALIVLILTVFIRRKKGEAGKFRFNGKLLLNGFGMGLCFAVCMYPQTKLSQLVIAPVQFTVTAAGAVLLSIMIACVKFREKFTLKHLLSTICCISAITLQLIV